LPSPPASPPQPPPPRRSITRSRRRRRHGLRRVVGADPARRGRPARPRPPRAGEAAAAERHRAHRLGELHLLRRHGGPRLRAHQQVLRGDARGALLRRERRHRRDREPVPRPRPRRVPPRRRVVGRQRAALLRLAGQLRRLHGAPQPARPHHGARPPLRWPPHPWLLHRGREEDLRDVDLLREPPLQGERRHGVHRLREAGGEGARLPPQAHHLRRQRVPRDWDYAKLRAVADKVGALLLCDMAHISGLVAAQEAANPFEYCDVVTTTTHKSLRGPRAGMIFYRKGPKPPKKGQPEGAVYDYEDKINFAVFPSLQGGPHNHQIAALAVALQQTMTPGFKAYAKQVKANAVAIGKYLMSKGYKMVTDGTENHLVLWDLRPLGLTGNKVEKMCDLCSITLNKNAVFGDSSALAPGGVRIGTPAMTSRGLVEKDFEQIGEFLHQAVTICLNIQKEHGKLLKDFSKGLVNNKDIENLKLEVEKFATSFDMPGFTLDSMKYKE
ncbi:Os11g0455800, partial [Oryza sativa Japonica Group]